MAETIKIEIPIEALDKTDPAISKIIQKFGQVDNASKNTQSSVTKATDTVSKFDQSADKTQKSLAKWAQEKYQILLEAKETISPIVEKLKSGLMGVAGKAWNITMKAIDLVTSPIKGIINLLRNPIFQVGAVLGISIGLKDTINTYATFEETMSRVKALAGANNDQMEKLTATAKKMGATTKYSGTESAEAFTYMAQAGWGVEEMISGINGVMSLAAADGLDLATTTDIVSNALTAFGLKAKDSAMFADVLAVASAATNTNVKDLGEAFKYVAPVAGALNYSIQDASMALGLMSNNAVKGSMAGTALKTSLANMAAPTKKMATAMDKYNISLTDNQGNIKNLKGVMDNLRSSLGGLSETEQTAAASTIFGKEAMAGMLSIINTSTEDYEKLSRAIYKSEGAADAMAETMQDNLAGALEQLGGAVETAQLTVGERLKPYLVSLAKWIESNIPMIESMAIKAFDSLDKKVAEMKKKIDDFTGTSEWKNADFFGRVKIAWDEIITKPFSDWWESTGKDWFARKSNAIGKGIGKAISTGFMTLLGIDVSTVADEGAGVGASFAKGFVDGIDVGAIQEKLSQVIKGVLSNAAEVLPGGKNADFSSYLSAALVAKAATSLFSMGKGVGSFLSSPVAVAGAGGSAASTAPLLGLMLGSAATGKGLLGLGSMTAINMGAGNLAGGASLSAGALSAVGLSSIAGGAIGFGTAFSGGSDLYSGFNSRSDREAEMYKKSGAFKVGGVAAGAATGAAIGASFAGIGAIPGALIGAGVGGIGGWIAGNGEKKQYEEERQKSIESLREIQLAQAQALYGSQELKDALKDTTMTAEEFAKKFRKAVIEGMRERFGDITLSLDQIQDMASKLVFDGSIEQMEKFSAAAGEAEQSLDYINLIASKIQKQNWKASMGYSFDETEIEDYRRATESLIANSGSHLYDRQYRTKAALELLVGSEASDELMAKGINDMYTSLQQQIDEKGEALRVKVELALEDGNLLPEELSEISKLQGEILSMSSQMAQSESEAKLKALEVKFGSDLTADSFADMQDQLQEYVNSAVQTYDKALEVVITEAQISLDNGAINQDQFDEIANAAGKEYRANIEGIHIRVENFQLEGIVRSYAEELEGILPEIEGSTSDKLQKAIYNAIAQGVNTDAWSADNFVDAGKWLGINDLNWEDQAAIVEMVSKYVGTIPEEVKKQIAENAETYKVDLGMQFEVFGPDGIPLEAASAAMVRDTGAVVEDAFSAGYDVSTDVRVKANYALMNPYANLSFSTSGSSGGIAVTGGAFGAYAEGGMIDHPMLSLIGEDGPEAVIPLGAKRRDRGISLWERAGEMLGVKKYAEGGIVGNLTNNHGLLSGSENWDNQDDKGESVSPTINQGGTIEVQVNVSSMPPIQIIGSGLSEDDIVRIMKSRLNEFSNDMAKNISDGLKESFKNVAIK